MTLRCVANTQVLLISQVDPILFVNILEALVAASLLVFLGLSLNLELQAQRKHISDKISYTAMGNSNFPDYMLDPNAVVSFDFSEHERIFVGPSNVQLLSDQR